MSVFIFCPSYWSSLVIPVLALIAGLWWQFTPQANHMIKFKTASVLQCAKIQNGLRTILTCLQDCLDVVGRWSNKEPLVKPLFHAFGLLLHSIRTAPYHFMSSTKTNRSYWCLLCNYKPHTWKTAFTSCLFYSIFNNILQCAIGIQALSLSCCKPWQSTLISCSSYTIYYL